jgi:hypothetical protein
MSDGRAWSDSSPDKIEPLWAMTKGEVSSTCELRECALRFEIRVSFDGQEFLTQVHSERAAAIAQAEELRRRLLARGWGDPP